MLNTIDDSLKTSKSGPAQQFVMALQDLLWREVAVLWGEFERRRPIPDADWIEIAALRLRVLSGLLTRRQDLVTEASSLYEGARATLDSLTLDEPTRDRLCAELTLEAGRVELALNRPAAAVALLEDSVAHAGTQPVPALLSLSDALRRADRLAEALAAAVRARDAADSAAQPALSRLLALGRIVQLTRAAGDAEAALAGAREGFALATELDNLGERAKFKGDEARALLTLKRFEDAAEAARVFRALAQNAYDDRLELSACGALVQALTGLGELAEAGRLAELGLAQAQALGATESVGAFLDDVWRLNSLAGAHAEAMDAGLAAASAYASIGLMPRVRHALGQAAGSFNALLHKAGPSGSAGALFRKARGELELLGYVSPDLQKAIVTESVTRFTELVQQGSDEAVAAGIDALAAIAGVA
jgi:tetratricopeptide (TPR) repeat protein